MRKLLLFLLLLIPTTAYSLQLFVVEADWCPSCRAWQAQVQPLYTPELDSYLPLIEINITHGIIENLDYIQYYRDGKIKKLYATPTFFIWDEEKKREIVRWVGYIDAEHWFAMLEKAIDVAKNSIKDCEEHNVCNNFNLN